MPRHSLLPHIAAAAIILLMIAASDQPLATCHPEPTETLP